MLGGTEWPSGEDVLTVTVLKDGDGYGMKVSGDNPVYVQSVKEHGAAWRAGLRAGDRILRVDGVPVHQHTHQQVVQMIRANATTALTVLKNASRHKTPITAPLPVNPEKQRQLEASKAHTVRLMLEKEQKYIRELRQELSKVPDVRKQAQLESAEQRCAILQHEIDAAASQPLDAPPTTPKMQHRSKTIIDKPASPPPNTGFLSGLPRSLSNLTGQSLRNLRQARQNKPQQENQPPIRSSEDRHRHNNTDPKIPTTCLDNLTPPPLPPRSIERPAKRTPLNPNMTPSPVNPLAKPKPCCSSSPNRPYYRPYPEKLISPMHQSMPSFNDKSRQFKRSSHSLDGELEGPQPNSIALQMSYPLVNAPPPPLKTDNRTNVPVLHVRSQSSPEHLEQGLTRCMERSSCSTKASEGWWERSPPPGTPPPPYAHNTQPCTDPQRQIISMEEDDSPSPDNSSCPGLFSNLLSVRESKARTAILLNWLLIERRCPSANLVLLLTDGFRAAEEVATPTLRRWAYEIQSTFLMPEAVLQLNGVDENMANEIEHVLVNEYEKEEILRNVFRKARQKAKEEMSQQLTEFQVKRQVGLGVLYGPDDATILKCDVDKAQEQAVVERIMCRRVSAAAEAARAASSASSASSASGASGAGSAAEVHAALLAALVTAALCLKCRLASVSAAAGGSRAAFLLRDKPYKQRLKQLAKNHPQPFVVRGHHLQLQALSSLEHCHRCDLALAGLAPQAYVCADCKLRVHRTCAKYVEESCCLDGEHHNNRISRFMERIHHNNQLNAQDSSDKKSRKTSGPGHFLNMERSFRRAEDEPEPAASPAPPSGLSSATERRDESDESLYESADCQSDTISASDDALPRLGKTPTISKESLKLAVTDEEADLARAKKGHRKTMSLSNPLEIVKNLGDDFLDITKRDIKKSRESLWSEEDRDSLHGSNAKIDQLRKTSRNEDNNFSNNRKSSPVEAPKTRKTSKGSSVGALSFLRRKKSSIVNSKPVEAVVEDVDKNFDITEILNFTKAFLENEKCYSSIIVESKPKVLETDSDDESPSPKLVNEHRRRLSRQTSRSKSKARGKSQSVKVNTLRKSHSGTLKKTKKKNAKTPLAGRSRQSSVVEASPIVPKKTTDSYKQNSWLFRSSTGESRREGSTEDNATPDGDLDPSDSTAKDAIDRDNNWRSSTTAAAALSRGVNRAESCRERDAPRRGKHRNASDPNRLTAHHNHDLEPGAATAPSGSSSSSSLSTRSNESNTVAAEHQASQSDWSEEDEPLAAVWADSLPPRLLAELELDARLRKRQEVIHELIVSEGSHVRWLKVLSFVFLRSLESQPSLLPSEELKALFPNLPAVRERHSKLYSDLRAARNDSTNHVVSIRPVADAILNTLGDPGYASCLSRFCRGQRMALDALRERRRKHKELHLFLAAREQQPLCGRLQLRDLLACVWQRLTKYQLLLESIVKTIDDGEESAEDADATREALAVAKRVLHAVDTAIRCAENEHRLKTIQNKLEVRVSAAGPEWEELRRLELTQRALRLEGELTIKYDSNKKTNVLALMFPDSLVLLQREGDRFLLKPFSQPGQIGCTLLSPLIKWDKVLFRPNAAVRHTFFLMNINGVQMHELSASSAAEYATWVKHIQEAPLARLAEAKSAISTITPSHQPTKSNDDSGINVSRNPSDASEKSTSTVPADDECERDRVSAERSETEMEDKQEIEREEKEEKEEKAEKEDKEGEVVEREEKHKVRRPTLGRISRHAEPAPPLEPRGAVSVHAPRAHTAVPAITPYERLRRLDASISRALLAKSAVVGALLGVPSDSYAQMADIAVLDSLGQVDVSSELRTCRLDRSSSTEDEPSADVSGDVVGDVTPELNTDVTADVSGDVAPVTDVHHLLLAAQAQANQLTEILSKALSVSEATTIAARASRSGRCDSCRRKVTRSSTFKTQPDAAEGVVNSETERTPELPLEAPPTSPDRDTSFDMLPDADLDHKRADDIEHEYEVCGAARLASRLLPSAAGLQGSLRALLAALPPRDAAMRDLRAELAAQRDRADRHRAATLTGYQMTEEISFPKETVDQMMQDQPSNGG